MTKPISRKMAVNCLLWRGLHCTTIRDHAQAKVVFICEVCGEILLPEQDIQFDHIHADVHGGPHEYQNLRPLHAECHKKKTVRDIKDNAKVKRLRGERKPRVRKRMPSRPMSSCAKPWPKRKFQKGVKP